MQYFAPQKTCLGGASLPETTEYGVPSERHLLGQKVVFDTEHQGKNHRYEPTFPEQLSVSHQPLPEDSFRANLGGQG